MNKGFAEAVGVFTELGWDRATPDQALTLPLGTPEQRRTALAGLRSGAWGEVTQLSENTWGWRSYVNVDTDMLGLYAVRLGVDARRATSVLSGQLDDELLTAVVAGRGTDFAASFSEHACAARRRPWEHWASAFGGVAVRLVARLGLPAPENVEYIRDWAAVAAAVLDLKPENGVTDRPEEPVIRERFAEHVRLGVTVGAPATGPFGRVVPEGVRRGWIGPAEAVDLVFAALDAAQRPGDRKAWVQALDRIGVADGDLVARADALIPLLATGDPFVIERIAPALIARAEDGLVVEALAACLSVPTKKQLRVVLGAAAARTRPTGAEALAGQLAALAAGRDNQVARLAARVVQQWSLVPLGERPGSGSLDAAAPPEPVSATHGLWQPTRQVWQVPRFDHGRETPDALTALTAELTQRPAPFDDVTAERFLAVANALARQDPQAAKATLRGVQAADTGVLAPVVAWVKGGEPPYGADEGKRVHGPLTARNFAVFQRLGQIPCLLSEPSTEDLAVSAADLAARLEAYETARATAIEADLFLALTRLDTASAGPGVSARLEKLDVLVVRVWADRPSERLAFAAGPAVGRYLTDPLREPAVGIHQSWQSWLAGRVAIPDSLKAFPGRLGQTADFATWDSYHFTEFPGWGDAAHCRVRWSSEVQRDLGLALRQVARRATPLPPGTAINLLATQRSMHPAAAEDSRLAVTEAWERGLLRPGVADVAYLDWSVTPPSNLARLATALVDIAQSGILSVVWPVLDDLIKASLRAPRMLAGTAEVAEVMVTLLPEVRAAVDAGIAEPTALDLPGIRALAARPGSSRAVTVAREIAALLPAPAVTVPTIIEPESTPDLPFDEVWPERTVTAASIPDGVTVTVDWVNPDAPTRTLAFDLVLPGDPDHRYRVQKPGWSWDLENEGQCEAWQLPPGVTEVQRGQPRIWLHWDAELRALVVTKDRNWVQGKDGPLRGIKAPPLSDSLITVIIGLLSQDGDARHFAPRLVEHLIEHRLIGSAEVHQAIQTLLHSQAVSPAKLVRPWRRSHGTCPSYGPC